MDWNAAIDRNREALKRVLVGLRAMAGLSAEPHPSPAASLPPAECPAPPAATLPRHLHRTVLRLLRAAEAAARRLVIVAARGLREAVPAVRVRQRRARRRPVRAARGFALFDPPRNPGMRRLRASAVMPRISFPGITSPAPLRPAPAPFDPIDTTTLARRLAALACALDDLPRQARRFARWRASRDAQAQIEAAGARAERPDSAAAPRAPSPAPRAGRSSRRFWPLRMGRPPGRQSRRDRRPAHQVHDILEVTHGLAVWALEPPDTS